MSSLLSCLSLVVVSESLKQPAHLSLGLLYEAQLACAQPESSGDLDRSSLWTFHHFHATDVCCISAASYAGLARTSSPINPPAE
jgi:hypothetical protein